MALAFVQKTPNSTTPTRQSSAATSITTPAFASNVGEGNLIIAYVSFFSGSGANPTFTFSDSKGNTWYTDKYANYVGAASIGVAIGHCIVGAGKGGSAFTVTCTMSASVYLTMGAIEASGQDPGIGSGGSANNGGTGASATASSGLIDIGSGNFLFVGATTWYDNTSATETSGWTEDHYQATDASYQGLSGEHIIGSGDKTATWALGTSTYWAAVGVAFAEAAGGGLSIAVAMRTYRNRRN